MTMRISSAKSQTGFRIYILAALVIVAIGIFIALCDHYSFVQDDAYISFRYAANFIDGQGLVYNQGERVEGYTNFLWVVGLIFFKKLLGLDYVLSARIFGVGFGAGLFALIAFLAFRDDREKPITPVLYSLILMLSCAAIPYWSISGLETSAYAFMILAALTSELYKPRLTAVFLVAATLLRPDGAVAWAIIFIHRIISDRRGAIELTVIYALLLAPFTFFKLFYYGSLLPNTFYAKSGLGLNYIASGWEYAVHFFRTVGVYGLILVPIALMAPLLWRKYRLLYLFIVTYTAYIIFVGGDVLKVYRFFLPIIPILFFLLMASLQVLVEKIMRKFSAKGGYKWMIVAPLIVIFAAASQLLARKHVNTFLANERGFTSKMQFAASMMKQYMGPSFTIAASTIGVLGYELRGHRMIDMLGLTDKYIARHPENIPGLESTWKERRYNSRYILEQQPDIIMFSTNDKPSAPAEKALFMHYGFRKNYFVSGFHREKGQLWSYFYLKRKNSNFSDDELLPNAKFVNTFYNALSRLTVGDNQGALDLLLDASSELPPDESKFLNYYKGECLYRLERANLARHYFEQALSDDPDDCRSRWRLGQLAARVGDTVTVNRLTREIESRQPWLLDFSH